MKEKKVSGSTEISRNDKYAVFEHDSLGRVFCFLSEGRYYALDGEGTVYDEDALSAKLEALGYKGDDIGPFHFTKRSTIDEFMLNFYRLYPAQPYAVRNTRGLYSDEFLNSYLKEAYRTADGFPGLPLFDGERISGRAWLRGEATVFEGDGYWCPVRKRGTGFLLTQDMKRDVFGIETEAEHTPLLVSDGFVSSAVHCLNGAKIFLRNTTCAPAFFLLCALAVIERQTGTMLAACRMEPAVKLFTPLDLEITGIVSGGRTSGKVHEYRLKADDLNECRRFIASLYTKTDGKGEFEEIVLLH